MVGDQANLAEVYTKVLHQLEKNIYTAKTTEHKFIIKEKD